MRAFQGPFGTAKADFLNRVRKFSFAAFAAFLIFTVFWFMPRPSDSAFSALVIDPDRFLQGSDPSWMPMSAAMCGGMLLCLLGFVYIKNTVGHDVDLGIFHLVQISPLKRSLYLLGKLLSNVFLLLLFLCFMAAASFVTMMIRFPGRLIPIYAFFSPFLCVIPGLFFVAAFALLTDCAPGFRKSSGLSIAVFLGLFTMILFMGTMNVNPYRLTSIFDFSGYMWIRDSISDAARAVTGQPVTHINVLTNFHGSGTSLKALSFSGLTFSASYLTDKLILIAFSIFLTFLSSLMLPKSQKTAAARSKQSPRETESAPARIPAFRFGLSHSEAAILLKGQPAFWWIAAAGLWIANCFSPLNTVRSTLFPIAFAWMLPVFSTMGCLEHQTGVITILRTIPKAPFRLAFCCWNTGLAVSLLTGFPVLLRLLSSGDFVGFLSALIFVVFVPSAALFLGEWTKTNRAFEIFHLVLCYLMINIPTLVFVGDYFTTASALRTGGLVLITGAMLFLTFAKRLAPRYPTA